MNPLRIFAPLSLLLAGCASTGPTPSEPVVTVTAVSPSTAAPDPVGAREALAASVTRPAITKAYYVNRIIDPDHPELLYGGVVFRREKEATWNTAGGPLDFPAYSSPVHTGPITSLPNGSEYPAMTPADAEIYRARTSELINALLEQNVALADKLSAVAHGVDDVRQDGPAATLSAPARSASHAQREQPHGATSGRSQTRFADGAVAMPGSAGGPPQAPPLATDERFVTIAPSADNVIELSPALLDPPIPGLTNPFRQRYQFRTILQETAVTIGGISLGEDPTCIIGDRLYTVGDSYETFTVAAIDEEGIYLRKDSFLLRIPMQDQPITLRYP